MEQVISKKIELDYGHTLPNHYSFCNQIHGHRASVVAFVRGKIIDDKTSSSHGMVYDFKILKELMMTKIHDVLDHGFAVWKDDKDDLEFITRRNKKFIVTDDPPTAEYLANWAFDQIFEDLVLEGIELIKVEWWETPNSCAICNPLGY